MADPFATPEDVADRWRDLTDKEEARAVVLLDDASRIIRREFPGIDDRIGPGVDQVDEGDLRMIAASMVKRALLGTDTGEGVTSESQVTGPFQVSRQYANPLGNLYLSAADRLILAGPAEPRARSVQLLPWWG